MREITSAIAEIAGPADMKLETLKERRTRLMHEAEMQGKKVPGRSLPRGYQWNGTDAEGSGSAAKRRLKQAERLEEKRNRKG